MSLRELLQQMVPDNQPLSGVLHCSFNPRAATSYDGMDS